MTQHFPSRAYLRTALGTKYGVSFCTFLSQAFDITDEQTRNKYENDPLIGCHPEELDKEDSAMYYFASLFFRGRSILLFSR